MKRENRALTNLEFGGIKNNRALSSLEFGSMKDNKALSSLEFNMDDQISPRKESAKVIHKKIIRLKNGKLGMFFIFESGNKLILPLEEKR